MQKALGDLKNGERGIVFAVRVRAPLDSRLREMGVVSGARVELLGRAPLGDPMMIVVKGYRLALRKSEARLIELSV